ncbi:MAG: conjugal transfer protein TraR [Desulfobacteraceae bacterium]|nr:TraR/DksA C4-type zinc finger protein [Desulfobacteraceae bacterium]MBC2755363.1 conjugal transfer protein TraR [Desulfobacteraceae bacterium]
MKNEQKEKFRRHITDKIQSLKKDIISYKELTRPIAPDNAIGRISRMEAINSKSINEEALRKTENSLVKLEHALKIIDDEDFGICIECDDPIPFARLMILPETNLCVVCAEKLTG